MNRHVVATIIVGLTGLFGVLPAGCSRHEAAPPGQQPPVINVSYPIERTVTDYVDFAARIAAVDSVDVRARVWGYLKKVYFKEGELVKKDQLLFEIDPAIYQAQYDAAAANLAQSEAGYQLAVANNQRYQELFRTNPGAVSQLDLDKYAAQVAQDAANVQAGKANVSSARLNLDWTKVVAPISGRISKYNVTEGNLVQSGETGGTVLTTIVSVDPIYANFDVDEHTVLRVRKLIREGKIKSARETQWPVSLGLAAEEDFPDEGTINFVDNQVNPNTGTLRVRGVFANKNEALSPGLFARVRVPIGPAHSALLVNERALDNDQGQKIVYVVNEKNEIVARPVRLGELHDGLREIEDGLKPRERLVVMGIQQVRPGLVVEPNLVEMPRLKTQNLSGSAQTPERAKQSTVPDRKAEVGN